MAGDRRNGGNGEPNGPLLTALTGTPGTGKSTAGGLLEGKDVPVAYLDAVARRARALRQYDARRGTWEVDLDRVASVLPRSRPLLLIGHLAHHLDVDRAIVLRCRPDLLRQRLAARGWSRPKVDENVEAEAVGVILMEAMACKDVYEVDTSRARPRDTARAVLDILAGRGEEYRPGKVDWSEAILEWY